MRNGRVTVGGVNVYNTYGAFIVRGGYKELLQWPELKSVSGNDWQEENGFEPDLSEPRLNSREFSITFACIGGSEKVRQFYDYLLTSPTMTYSFLDIGRSLDLRVVSMPSLKYAVEFNILSVRFACDDPLAGYSASSPSSTLSENRDYVIDGVPLSSYGVRALKGTIEGTLKRPDVKPLLIRNTSAMDGAEYDKNPVVNDPNGELGEGYATVSTSQEGVSGNWKRSTSQGEVTVRKRDITLHCLLTAPSFSNAWRNYDALLYDLTKKNEGATDPTEAGSRRLVVRALATAFDCYYKSQQVEDFYIGQNGEVWIKFNVTLTLYREGSNGFFPDDPGGGGGGGGDFTIGFFLASEDNGFVITEDGKLIAILP